MGNHIIWPSVAAPASGSTLAMATADSAFEWLYRRGGELVLTRNRPRCVFCPTMEIKEPVRMATVALLGQDKVGDIRP